MLLKWIHTATFPEKKRGNSPRAPPARNERVTTSSSDWSGLVWLAPRNGTPLLACRKSDQQAPARSLTSVLIQKPSQLTANTLQYSCLPFAFWFSLAPLRYGEVTFGPFLAGVRPAGRAAGRPRVVRLFGARIFWRQGWLACVSGPANRHAKQEAAARTKAKAA
jgi:hypothetical protein